MAALLFFLGRKNSVYQMGQSLFVKVSGIQLKNTVEENNQ